MQALSQFFFLPAGAFPFHRPFIGLQYNGPIGVEARNQTRTRGRREDIDHDIAGSAIVAARPGKTPFPSAIPVWTMPSESDNRPHAALARKDDIDYTFTYA